MNHNTPLSHSPRPLRHLSHVQRRVLTTAQLKAHGVTAAETNEQCRPGGPWQQFLPGVFLLHPGPPTSEERLHAVLMFAARSPAQPVVAIPVQPGAEDPHAAQPYTDVLITGLAALTLHGFTSAPPLLSLDKIDVMVPGCAACAPPAASASSVRRPSPPPRTSPASRSLPSPAPSPTPSRSCRTRTRYAVC